MSVSTAPGAQLDAPPDSPGPESFDGQLLRVIAGGVSGVGRGVQRREARYRRFLDALGVAMYTTDAAGRITFFNRASTAFWGRHPALGEEWCGSLRMYTTDGVPLPHASCPMALALTTRQAMHGAEAIAERPDGTRVWFMAYPTPLLDDDGELVGAVNVLIDVTERRRAEEALRETAGELARSNAVKDEFLGLVSHELRTPVTTILGNARLLRDRGDTIADDVKRGMLDDIDEDAHRLHVIIENLLALARLTSSSAGEHEPQVVGHVVTEAVAAFQRRHPTRELRLQLSAPSTIVDADAAHLHLLLENFLSNAAKYSPAGSPIDITVERNAGEIELRVLDRGMGLGDGSDELFEPFFRTDAARRQAGGVGIGLAVCRRVVESIGGRIWATPRPGGGSEFGVGLPIAPDAEA